MPDYVWQNKDTGEIKEVTRRIHESHIPPAEPGDWVRLITPVPVIRAAKWGKKGDMK